MVAELELEGAAAQSEPEELVSRQMPNTGTRAATSSRTFSMIPVSGSGSPGPFDSTTPSTGSASTSLAGVRAGSTVSRAPRSASERRMLVFTPKS